MAMNKSTGILVACVLGLSIACVGLLIALSLQSDDSSSSDKNVNPTEKSKNLGSPIISGSTDDDFELEGDAKPEDWNGEDDSEDQENESILNFPWEKNVRLPSTILPLHYELYLFPELQEGMFSGRVDIEVDSQESRDYFLAHVKYLEVIDAKLTRNGNNIDLIEAMEYEPHEFYVMRTRDIVPAGKYVMHFEFRGNLTRSIVGFYKSDYTNSKGDRIPIATSKFQPTYARRAFPCFDEPSFKSTFTVTLVRPSDRYIALSNMPVDNEMPNNPSKGYTEVKFEKSVPMVTYLACFIVCDFEYEEKLTEIHKTKFRVYATPEQKERLKYALDIGANITDYFENYFEIPYPLPKQDMIAIPDFVSGAMEHWGLITYRETNLLFDERESSSPNKQRVASVVSHELAHQWFGNLVTLSWWDDLWLNEGFASYMEYKGVANYHQDWDMESQFLNYDLHRVMDLDATISSHPIIQPVNHPDQITEIFDAISYAKGASVLRMLEDFMGAEEFRIGIKRFLKKFEYGNAVTADLWQELSSVSSKQLNISKIMDTWTRQMGYPVLTVERVKTTEWRLSQERYLTDPTAKSKSSPSPYDYRWDVPITWITSTDTSAKSQKWLGSDEPFVLVNAQSGTEWLKFNVGQYGFYRVNYPEAEWNNFADLLMNNHEILSTKDRAHLLNDAFSLAESGHVPYSIPLAMTKYLKKENSLIPWESAYDKIVSMGQLLIDTPTYPLFRKYVLSLVSDHYDRLQWVDNGSHNERIHRINILTMACRNGHKACLDQAGDRFLAWIRDKSAYIPPNLRVTAYKYGMLSKGDETTWDTMLQRYISESNAQEKAKLLRGLAWIDQPWIIRQFLRLAKNETIVRSQDFMTCLRYIGQNPIGLPIVWEFMRNEWPYLVDRFSLNDRYLGRMPKYLSYTFSSQLRMDELDNFFKKYPEAGAGKRAREQARENIQNNVNWLKTHQETIHQWFSRNLLY